MVTEVTLVFTGDSGNGRRVTMDSDCLTLGRGSGNDVVINDSNLSREHAVIENIRGSVKIRDCNSRNGTLLNGNPIIAAVEVFDGDLINLGGSCEIALEIRQVTSSRPSVSLPVVAGIGVVLLLILGGLILAAYFRAEPARVSANTNTTIDEPRIEETPQRQPTPAEAEKKNPEDPSAEIATAVKRVMTKLSKDSAPYISDAGIEDVKRRVEEYRGSSELRERLRAAKDACPEITADADRISVRPALVMYAALADSEGQSGNSPINAARRMTPRLLSLRATFGTETANSSLLLIAAYPYPFNPQIGTQTRTPHPLAAKLVEVGGRRSTVETSEARTVWFLREKNAITDEAYDFVIRFLAIGVIAQNPKRYGIDADPLLC
jgi:pSer/pThr/pTyr-binding forkhead associated (FHA) protein